MARRAALLAHPWSRLSAVVAVLGGLGGAACGDTAILVVMEGPFEVPTDVDSLTLTVEGDGATFDTTFTLDGDARPLEETFLLRRGEQIRGDVDVSVAASLEGELVAEGAASARFLEGAVVTVPVLLAALGGDGDGDRTDAGEADDAGSVGDAGGHGGDGGGAGDPDAGLDDGGLLDGGALDGGPVDGGDVNGGVLDGGLVDGGPVDGGVYVPGPPVLVDVHPQLAAVGGSVWLEGTFDADALVTFTGAGPEVPLTRTLHRLEVVVPPGARTGPVVVEQASGSLVGSRVEVRAYVPSVDRFSVHHEQVPSARAPATLPSARPGACGFVVGDWLVVLGGRSAGAPSAEVWRSRVWADGTLGPFEIAGALDVARADAGCARVSTRSIVVVGGRGAGGALLSSSERVDVGTDGAVTSTPGPALAVPRARAAVVVTANVLTVVGGETSTGATEIGEEARLVGGDIVGATFGAWPYSLSAPRAGSAVARVGGEVLLLGGDDGANATSEIWLLPTGLAGTLGLPTLASVELGEPRTDAAVLVLGDELVVLGGRATPGGVPLASGERGSSSGGLGSFTALPGGMLEARAAHVAVAARGRAHVCSVTRTTAGGSSRPG